MYSLRQIEEIVAKGLKIPPAKRSAFSAKVKYYRKLNFPPLPKTGKGNHADFSSVASLQLLIVFRLEQLGLSPKLAMRGALKISAAVEGRTELPPNPYLIFDGKDFSIAPAEAAAEILERRASAILVSISELMQCYQIGLQVVAAPEPDKVLEMALQILEARDGEQF